MILNQYFTTTSVFINNKKNLNIAVVLRPVFTLDVFNDVYRSFTQMRSSQNLHNIHHKNIFDDKHMLQTKIICLQLLVHRICSYILNM